MKGVIILFWLFALCYSVTGLEYESVFEGEISNNAIVSADNQSFKVSAFSGGKAVVDFPNGVSRFMDTGECETVEAYRLCILSITMSEKFNITKQEYPIIPKIKIEKKKNIVGLNRTFEKNSILLEERIKVSVVMVNEGEENIVGAIYQDKYPKEIAAALCEGCIISDNEVSWIGNLNIGKKQEFSYFIIGKNSTGFESNATLLYGGMKVTEKHSISVNANRPLIINYSVPDSADLGEEIKIFFRLINNNSESIENIRFRLVFPQGMKFIGKTGRISDEGNFWVYRGKLSGSGNGSIEEDNITFQLAANRLGKAGIAQSVFYSYRGSNYNEDSNYTIDVDTEGMYMEAKTIEAHEPSTKAVIPIILTNTNYRHSFKNIKIEVVSNGVKRPYSAFNSIPPREIKELEVNITVPDEQQEVEILLSYETNFGQIITKKNIVTFYVLTSKGNITETGINVNNSIGNKSLDSAVTEDELVGSDNKIWIYAIIITIIVIIVIMLLLSKLKKDREEEKLMQLLK